MKPSPHIAKFVAESIATFALVFCGTGAIAANEVSGGAVTHVGVSLVFGLIVLAMIYAVGHVSGAHMNPAVSIAFAVVKRLSYRELPLYLSAQAIGAFIASLMVKAIFPASRTLGASLPSGSLSQSFWLEVALTFLLMFVIMGVAHDERAEGEMAGIAIGGTVALEALFGGPISGASMNPIRSLAPAVVSGHLTEIWLYLLAPTFGAVTGAMVHRLVRCDSGKQSVKTGCC